MIPLNSIWVSEVDKAVTSLPEIPLPNVAVLALDEVAVILGFLKQWGLLGNVWVDPDTDFDTAVVNLLDQTFWIRELFLVPEKRAPFKPFLPETVKVKDVERNFPVMHAIDELQHSFSTVISGK